MQQHNSDKPDDRWRLWFLLFWALFVAYMLFTKWVAIRWFALGDTDDNMRMAQVRALIDGQGWYDLRQHRLDPPRGASIHWTRLVDLPIAGLILAIKPFFGGWMGEKWAAAIAPMLALGPALYALMLSVRRLVAPMSFPLAAAILICAQSTMLMWMPLRIDHHGWQLAMLIVAVAGCADLRQARGGVTVGVATAISLTIGLELMPYMAVAGATLVLRWVWDRGQADRLRAYGVSLAGGSALGFALFASYDNRQMLCDVLSPVYLSVTLVAGALVVLLAALKAERRGVRLAAAAAAGALIAVGFAHFFPQCLGRPEQISPELDRLWFSSVKEAKPVYQHGYRIALPIVALPVIGVVGSLFALWRARRTERLAGWVAVAALSCMSTGLLFWQTRAGPGAQLLAVPGATALGWALLPRMANHRLMLVRVFGTVAAFLLVSGLFVFFILQLIPNQPASGYRKQIDLANRRCPTLPALAPIAKLPAATIMTFVDFGPRLIAVTHHSAIAGPYHRNGPAILDIHYAFLAKSPEVAHRVMLKHGATLLLLCPGMSESTLYASRARDGFYNQLMRDRVPPWLERMPLPANSPFRLWRLVPVTPSAS